MKGRRHRGVGIVAVAAVFLVIGSLAWAGSTREQPAKPVTIELWDFQNTENWTQAFNGIFAAFQKDHPNVTINRKTQSFAEGEATVKAAALSGNIPDILNLWAGEIMFSWEDGGLIENLEPVLRADKVWWDRIGKVVTGDPVARDRNGKGIWVVPADVYTEVALYYKDVSKANGLVDPPLTVDDIVANAEKLKSATSLIPIGTGILDPGMLRELFLVFVAQQLGDGMKALDMYQAAERGTQAWQNDVFLTAVTGIAKLARYHTSDALTLDQQTVGYQRLFTKKTWYEWYCGSWMIGEFEKQAAQDIQAGNAGIAPYPAVTRDVKADFTVSGMGATLSLSTKTKNRDVALALLKFLSDPVSTTVFAKNSIFPAAPVPNAQSILSPFFAQYLNTVGPLKIVPYPIGVVADATNEFQTNLQNMFLGELTPAKVLQNMDKFTKK